VDIFKGRDDQYCLTIIDTDIDAKSYELFDERELHGGGYTWRGVVWSLIETHLPGEIDRLQDIGAEADNMYLYCAERGPLERVAQRFRAALADHRLLNAAIDHAGGEIE
jgi:hypothetical protein